MKHSTVAITVLAVSLAIGLASCAGAPPAQDVTPDPAASASSSSAVAVNAEELAAAREKAEKARKSAFDLEAKEFFPEDWASAESAYLRGKQQESSDGNAAIAAYNEAAASFDALSAKAQPRYAEKLSAEMAKAREQAVAAGAQQKYPARLAVADANAAAARAQLDAGKLESGVPAAQNARDSYLALASILEAERVRAKIDENAWQGADPSNYELAQSKLTAALADFDALSMAGAREKAEEARLRFNLAYRKGHEGLARAESVTAVEERKAAEAAKAQVASKDVFEQGQSALRQADAAFAEERFDESAELYAKARALYIQARDSANDKRRKAEEAMAEANRRMAESLEAAQKADAILEGGSR